MSFSSNLKERLSLAENSCEFCTAAELAGIFRFAARMKDGALALTTENAAVARCICRMVKESFGADIEYNNTSNGYRFLIENENLIENIAGRLALFDELDFESLAPFACCRVAFVRGAFLGGGSISDPKRSYHMEFAAKEEQAARELESMLFALEVEAKSVYRKGYYIVYIKEYETIAGLLGLLGAGNAAMEIYNISIEKDIRNSVNRQVNCESANIDKVARAYVKHLAAIEKIKNTIGIEKLPEGLKEIAAVRLENPDMSLKDLGALLEVPIGKSGVNHRLNRLLEIAEKL